MAIQIEFKRVRSSILLAATNTIRFIWYSIQIMCLYRLTTYQTGGNSGGTIQKIHKSIEVFFLKTETAYYINSFVDSPS